MKNEINLDIIKTGKVCNSENNVQMFQNVKIVMAKIQPIHQAEHGLAFNYSTTFQKSLSEEM